LDILGEVIQIKELLMPINLGTFVIGKSRIRLAGRRISKHPYWKKPYLLRQWLHLTGRAIYHDQSLPWRKRVVIYPFERIKSTFRAVQYGLTHKRRPSNG
jgi:hypothetical protein